MSSDELLREALVDLAKARQDEEWERRKSEALLAGLRVLIEPMESSRMFSELLEVMRGGLDFAEAFLLLRRPDGSLLATIATSELFLQRRWAPGAMFRRVLNGELTTVFDAGMNDEWRKQPPELRAQAGSALHIPLLGGEQAAILVCTHPDKNHFNRNHRQLANDFASLASQALLNAERQQLESQLFQTRKMEALGMLAGGVAHDFNNILTPIFIHSQMAMLEAAPDSPLQQNLRQIEQAAERAGALIRQILDFNRQGKHEPRSIHLGPVIREALKFLRSTIAPNIELEYKQHTGDDLVAADPTQMLQVVMNLAINGAHAMGEAGGRLLIELRAADQPPPLLPPTTSAADQQSWLKLTVTDTGPGITPENLNRIFDPFFTTKGKGEGSGMGLAVVHGIISKHGGVIGVYSEPNQGASFEIMLPKISTQSPTDEKIGAVAGDGGGERILFVDDEPPLIAAFAPMLKRFGYRVESTTSPRVALEMIERHPDHYDLLITDYNMPEINGGELALKVMKLNPKLPVILCTGFCQLDEPAGHELGIAACVHKPFKVDELIAAIRATLKPKGNPREN